MALSRAWPVVGGLVLLALLALSPPIRSAAQTASGAKNYGLNAIPGGANRPRKGPATQPVKLSYDHTTPRTISPGTGTGGAAARGTGAGGQPLPSGGEPDDGPATWLAATLLILVLGLGLRQIMHEKH